MFLCLAGCNTLVSKPIAQSSTIDAILAGAYDGEMTCRELLSYGDFGIGTFDKLDGEMILLNGRVYQVKADGKVYHPAKHMTTPFATAVKFRSDIITQITEDTNFNGLAETVNGAIPNMNNFIAVKARGYFKHMKTRSVPAQKKPYPPLTEVTKEQPVFNLADVSGTIVGFRMPAFTKSIAVPGFHLHFISDDATSGGHVLDFLTSDAILEMDIRNRFFLILPSSDESDFAKLNFSEDRSDALKKAER